MQREVHRGGSKDGNIQLRDGRWLSLSRRQLSGEAGEILLLADVTDSQRVAELRQRNERLTAIGEMTAEFAHQVRTPLASALLYLDQLDRTEPSNARAVDKVAAQLYELKRMVDDMLGFAAGAQGASHKIAVETLLLEVKRSLDGQLKAATTLRISVPDSSLEVATNIDALKGALLNLITNADQAAEGGADILLHGHNADGRVHLCVTDNGPGIPERIRPRLFEPFFTTRPQGTGLGLSVVRTVAQAHSGEVSFTSSALGTCFTIALPATATGGVNP